MKNGNEIADPIEEKRPAYTKAFTAAVPEFSFSVNGTQVVIRVKTIVGAENYEVYQCRTPRGKYAVI